MHSMRKMSYVIKRMGTAKEIIESTCKSILTARSEAYSRNADIPELVKQTRCVTSEIT